jgi:uncharacterized protein YpuA (DUF1002 family)
LKNALNSTSSSLEPVYFNENTSKNLKFDSKDQFRNITDSLDFCLFSESEKKARNDEILRENRGKKIEDMTYNFSKKFDVEFTKIKNNLNELKTSMLNLFK